MALFISRLISPWRLASCAGLTVFTLVASIGHAERSCFLDVQGSGRDAQAVVMIRENGETRLPTVRDLILAEARNPSLRSQLRASSISMGFAYQGSRDWQQYWLPYEHETRRRCNASEGASEISEIACRDRELKGSGFNLPRGVDTELTILAMNSNSVDLDTAMNGMRCNVPIRRTEMNPPQTPPPAPSSTTRSRPTVESEARSAPRTSRPAATNAGGTRATNRRTTTAPRSSARPTATAPAARPATTAVTRPPTTRPGGTRVSPPPGRATLEPNPPAQPAAAPPRRSGGSSN